ncbi:PPK2 family polyphosphate kinase [Isoptericola sediminis]|uniref:Polyphosphate kinase 2 family protein n=1 Tax=Isoptericola sediminis TaxID=2733572 RepID=A0A849K5I9_9MICO|nr:PPK2 family polyphosphate kinase [Isoptericola sediminis]NNU28648.1 polyphosphate kinase 2 family protein [Isoptericola sediminis]
MTAAWTEHPATSLRWRPGDRLDALDTRSTPGYTGRKRAAKVLRAGHADDLSDLQERLFAHGRTGGVRSVLLILQGMDTSGKGGIVRHVVGMVDPQGVRCRGFGRPTPEEQAHDFLWRIRRALPSPGLLGVFDRSHYEDVLVVRVEELQPEASWRAHYDEINAFEAEIAAAGTEIVKVMLAISPEEQLERLVSRLDRPEKHWRYDPADLRARERWGEYQAAYQEMLDRTSTDVAPWYVVPADRKWFARLAVSELLRHTLRGLDLRWPAADFDVERQRRLLTGG